MIQNEQRQLTDFSYAMQMLIVLLMDTQMLIEIDVNLIPFLMVKTCVDCLVFLVLLYLLKDSNNHKKILFVILCYALIIVSIIILPDECHCYWQILIIERISFKEEEGYGLYYRLILRVALLGATIPTFDRFQIPLISCLVLKELYLIYMVKKEASLNCSGHSPISPHMMLNTLRQKENFWKDRIQIIPVSIMLIKKSSEVITYKNKTLLNQFNQYQEKELEKLIMNDLLFETVQSNIQRFKSQNRVIYNQLRTSGNTIQPRNNSGEQLQHSKSSLHGIVKDFKQGMYLNLMNRDTNSLELICKRNESDGKIRYLQGQIIENEDEDELIVMIQDITSQAELQQYLIKDEFKTKLIESFSHELRTPLNSAMNFLNIAIQDGRLPLDITQQLIRPAISALNLQSYLINDIIDFTQKLSQGFDLQCFEFPIEELIKEIHGLFSCQFELKNITFHIDLFENQMTTICTDYKRLMQVIVNILSNAIKYTPQGGQIGMKVFSDQNSLSVTIRDDGIGIEKEKLNLIREALHQITFTENIATLSQWHGFGLLVSTLLLSDLASDRNSAVNIKSNGKNMGTKVKFKIQNKSISDVQQNLLRNVTLKRLTLNHLSGNVLLFKDMKSSLSDKSPESLRFSANCFPSMNSMGCCSVSRQLQNLQLIPPAQFITDIQKQLNGHGQATKPQDQAIQYIAQNSRVIHKVALNQYIEKQFDDQIKIIQQKSSSCGCKRILSVDDEIFNQRSVQMLLNKLGFEVLVAFNGQEAIQVLKGLKICCETCSILTLILMDYQMPLLDGIETTKILMIMMENNEIPIIPIIGLTAFTNTSDINRCLQAGMKDVLAKPLIIREFCDVLQLL